MIFKPLTRSLPRPARVLMTTSTEGEYWVQTMELVRALAPCGVHVTLAALGPPPDITQRTEAGLLRNLDLYDAPPFPEFPETAWNRLARVGEWLLRLEDEVAPDVVHLHGFLHAALPWSAPVLAMADDDRLTRWRAFHGRGTPPTLARYREAVRAGLHAADLVATPTRARFIALCTAYAPIPVRHAPRILPPGRSGRDFAALEKQPFILTTGPAWEMGKHFTALDEAAAGLPWPVFFSGPVRGPGGVRRSFSHFHLPGKLAPPEQARRLGHAAIFALPSRHEPIGLSVLDAALCGCALILGDLPSLRETWGDTALYTPPGDAGALRDAALLLIADRRLRARLGEAARRRAEAFSALRLADTVFETYRDLLASSALHTAEPSGVVTSTASRLHSRRETPPHETAARYPVHA